MIAWFQLRVFFFYNFTRFPQVETLERTWSESHPRTIQVSPDLALPWSCETWIVRKQSAEMTGLWEVCLYYLEWKETSRDQWSNKMPAYLAVGCLRGLFRCFERSTSLRHVGSRRRQTAMFLLQAGFLQKVRLWHNGSAKEDTRTWGSAWGLALVLACMPDNLACYILADSFWRCVQQHPMIHDDTM